MSSLDRALRLEHARERLASLSRGGSIHRPIEVSSASVIEPRVAALSCPHCGGRYRIEEHTRPVPDRRRVDVTCRHCSAPRVLWFHIAPTPVSN